MRRSSVRLRLWASTPHPHERKLLRVFLSLNSSNFPTSWHASGTQSHNIGQNWAKAILSVLIKVSPSVQHSKTCENLFQRAVSVPYSLIDDLFTVKINDIRQIAVTLSMRSCGFCGVMLTFSPLQRS